MIHLKINPTRKEDLRIKIQLSEMFLATKVEESNDLSEPQIIQGGEEYTGNARIQVFFDELQNLYAGWYEDRCDKYENEDGSQMFD